jgi:hypothetical protein
VKRSEAKNLARENMDFLLLKPDASPSRLCVAASAERDRLNMTIKTVSLGKEDNTLLPFLNLG